MADRPEPRVRQGIYALRTVIPPRPAAGSPRAATRADRPLLLDWWRAFGIEALGDSEPDEERVAENVDRKLSEASGWDRALGGRGPTGLCGGLRQPDADRESGSARSTRRPSCEGAATRAR